MANSPYHIRQRKESESVVPVRDAVTDFLASSDVKRLQPGTQAEYKMVLSEFSEWCASHSLVQNKKDSTWHVEKVRKSYDPIALHQVNAQVHHLFMEHLAETHKPAKNRSLHLSDRTFVLYTKDIKRFLNWCVLDEQYCQHVMAVTIQRIKMPTVEQTVIEVFTEEDIDALFRACQKEQSEHLEVRDTAILSLLLDSAIRASELCSLTIGNVNLDPKDPHIRVNGKGKKWGEVGFGERARRSMQKYQRQFREPTVEYRIADQLRRLPPREAQRVKKQTIADARFFVNRSGEPLTRSGLGQLFERLGEWAGIEDVRCSPHTCRHAYSYYFMLNGGDIYQLSRKLRHTSVKVTEVYLRALQGAAVRRGMRSVLDNL
jgi:integrase/recombinase XerD